MKNCRSCHGLRYLGQSPALSPEDARSAFGRVPPDLSLMTLARGRGTTGAKYVYSLLTSFSDTPEWNRVLPGIAMPDPFRGQSGAEAQARDVAAFLYRAADPHAAEGRTLGRYVLGYMAVLTFLLFLVNRRIWRELAAGRV